MGEVVEFVPLSASTAKSNLAEFLRVCRDELHVFGRMLRWEENYWPEAGVAFGNLDQTSRRLSPERTMRLPFCDFAKAYFRYQQGHKPTLAQTELRALKCLERALSENGRPPDVLASSLATFDRAAALATEYFSAGMAYHAGRELERLSKFLSEKRLVGRHLDWCNPLRRPEDTVRTGREAKVRREAKLPSDEAIEALAEIFASGPTVDRDIFTTSTAAMLLSAPSRGSAVLALKDSCEVTERKRDGTVAYGWRFPADKGAEPSIKWVPDAMADVAKTAISRLRKVSAEARRLATWLETNPDHFYRHPSCPDVPENAPLSTADAARAIGIPSDDERYARTELQRRGLSGTPGAETLASLNRWIHSRLPADFPWFDRERGVKFSEALFCFRERQLRTDMGSSPVCLVRVTINVFNNDLASRATRSGYQSPSIFDRHGFRHRDGASLKLTSHQFRHLLNTMAQRGGLGQAEIARWSGRVDFKQNRSYDHMSEFELVDLLRKHDPSLSLDRPLEEIADRLAALIPITRQEFNALATPTAHVTEYGFCVHDFVMSPCQRFRDCLNCTEHVCIKGDRRMDRIRTRYAQVLALKERAEREIAEGSWGADRWYEIHALTAKRLSELISILDRADVAEGAIIRLRNDDEFSWVRMALEAKGGAVSTDRRLFQSSTSLLENHGKAPN